MSGNPWNRQEEETARAFHAFICYRDMAPSRRSLVAVVERFKKPSGYARQLATWSSRYNWVERAAAHDVHLDEVRGEAQTEAIREMAERQAQQGIILQNVGLRRFISRATGKIRDRIAAKMDDNDAIRAILDGAKLERTARGEPTEIQKTDVTVRAKPMNEYSDEELLFIAEHGSLPPGSPEP